MGGEKNIEINSSVEWKVEVPAEFKEWLSAEADGNNLTLKAGYNNLFITRVGHVLLYPKSNVPGFEGVPVEVRQLEICGQTEPKILTRKQDMQPYEAMRKIDMCPTSLMERGKSFGTLKASICLPERMDSFT